MPRTGRSPAMEWLMSSIKSETCLEERNRMKTLDRLLNLSLFQLTYKSVRVIRHATSVTFRPARPPAPDLKAGSPAPAPARAEAPVGWPKPQHRWMV
jgi:hypothetical protein